MEVTKGHALPPSRTIPWIALASSLALLGGCASSDGSPRADGIEVGTTHQAIFAGTADNDEAASAGVVSIKIGNGTSFELCTGSLLAPNVVLTARHCVSKTLKTVVSCNELGQSGNGDHVGDDEVLSDVHVYSGERPAFGGPPSAGVSAVVHPDGGVLCNADIALLVLDGPITDVSPMRVRLSSAPRSGESFRAVGYGQNDDKLPVGTRIRKDAVKVLAIGQKVSASQTPLGSREFEVGLSICQGDSGGPAISEDTGAVIGVVSRGGDCTDDFGHIYTATSGFPDLFTKAFTLAGARPLDEGDPGPAPQSQPDESGTAAAAKPAAHGCSMGGGAAGGGGGGASGGGAFGWLAALAGALGLAKRRRR